MTGAACPVYCTRLAPAALLTAPAPRLITAHQIATRRRSVRFLAVARREIADDTPHPVRQILRDAGQGFCIAEYRSAPLPKQANTVFGNIVDRHQRLVSISCLIPALICPKADSFARLHQIHPATFFNRRIQAAILSATSRRKCGVVSRQFPACVPPRALKTRIGQRQCGAALGCPETASAPNARQNRSHQAPACKHRQPRGSTSTSVPRDAESPADRGARLHRACPGYRGSAFPNQIKNVSLLQPPRIQPADPSGGDRPTSPVQRRQNSSSEALVMNTSPLQSVKNTGGVPAPLRLDHFLYRTTNNHGAAYLASGPNNGDANV